MGLDVAREGLRRLRPLRHFTGMIRPEPRTRTGRVCALESAHYMRNQLLRDADWAGMAHGIEIRVPLIDVELLRSTAPLMPSLAPGAGKKALAVAPSLPLPSEVVKRAKTGFTVPTAAWTTTAAGTTSGAEPRGLTSRHWSKLVIARSPLAPNRTQTV